MRETEVFWNLWRDFRFGLRMLRRNSGFAAVAVLTLALGIGAATAIFSVVKSVLLDPLPYHEADRIVALQTWWTKRARASSVSGGDYPDLVGPSSPFQAASRYIGGELAVRTGNRTEFVSAVGTDAGFSSIFRLSPAAGRLISSDEYAPGLRLPWSAIISPPVSSVSLTLLQAARSRWRAGRSPSSACNPT